MPVDLNKEFSTWVRFSNSKYFEDYLRIQRLMLDEEAFLERADVLESAVREAYDDPSRIETLAKKNSHLEKGVLAAVLRDKESRHGFKAGVQEVPTLTGVISGEKFLMIVDQGRPMKDVGVSRDHGEYTHRIQWYIIMVDHERSKYKHAPLELYRHIYKLGPPINPGPLKSSMWDCLFDRPGYDQPSPEDDMEDYMRERETRYHSHFTCPENLNRFLLDAQTGMKRLPFLWKCMSVRDAKRGRQIAESGGTIETFKQAYARKLATTTRHATKPELDDNNNIWWKR